MTDETAPEVHFDICFIVGACTKGKYLTRLQNFLEYGFLNCSARICVDLLFNTEDDLAGLGTPKQGDNPKITCRPLRYDTGKITGTSQNTVKFCKYLMQRAYPKARWYIRVDDDSVTDVDHLLRLLDGQFRADDHHFLIADRLNDMDNPIVLALKYLNIDITGYGVDPNNGSGAFPLFTHEWEFGCFSANTFHEAMDNPDVNKILDFVSKRGGNTDQITSLMARIIKVHPVQFPWATPHASIAEFSGVVPVGARFAHIHYCAEDVQPQKWQFFKAMFSSSGDVIKSFCEVTSADKRPRGCDVREIDLVEAEYTFDFGGGKGTIKFNSDHTIGIHRNDNERYWEVKNGLLIIRNRNQAPASIFVATTGLDSNHMMGVFLESWATLKLDR